MKIGEKYLAWSTTLGGGNKVYLSTATDAAAQWSITFDTSGNAAISNVETSARLLQYNTNSPRFACYTGTQKNPVIYLVEGLTA